MAMRGRDVLKLHLDSGRGFVGGLKTSHRPLAGWWKSSFSYHEAKEETTVGAPAMVNLCEEEETSIFKFLHHSLSLLVSVSFPALLSYFLSLYNSP